MVAHEMAHVKNYDVRLMTVVAALVGSVLLISDWGRRGLRFGGRRRSEQGERRRRPGDRLPRDLADLDPPRAADRAARRDGGGARAGVPRGRVRLGADPQSPRSRLRAREDRRRQRADAFDQTGSRPPLHRRSARVFAPTRRRGAGPASFRPTRPCASRIDLLRQMAYQGLAGRAVTRPERPSRRLRRRRRKAHARRSASAPGPEASASRSASGRQPRRERRGAGRHVRLRDRLREVDDLDHRAEAAGKEDRGLVSHKSRRSRPEGPLGTARNQAFGSPSVDEPRGSRRPLAAPRHAASITPPVPPQTTTAPRRASSPPIWRASSRSDRPGARRWTRRRRPSIEIDVSDRPEVSPLVFSNSSSNFRLRTSFLDFSASMEAANFFSLSTSCVFIAPIASSTDWKVRGVFGASWSMTALSSGSILSRALQQGQSSSKSMAAV